MHGNKLGRKKYHERGKKKSERNKKRKSKLPHKIKKERDRYKDGAITEE